MKVRRTVIILITFIATIIIYLIGHDYVIRGRNVLSPATTNANGVSQMRRFTFNIAVVACGQRLQETLTMIKSAILFNYHKDKLHFLIFAEDHLRDSFKEKLNDWTSLIPGVFDFDIFPLQFPLHGEAEWKALFKPCAAQRLFLPALLQSFDSLLYVDTDIVFLSPVSDIWKFFARFNETQLAALTQEHEDPNIGWYNRFARHPYYGPLGVNSGVMLMNLTRMRQFKWEEHILPIYKEYKLRITWGDQDIINILFYYHPEKLFILPCEFNYRPDHCMYMSVCDSNNGIQILHGNRGYFHSNKQPLFRAIFEAIERYQIRSNPYNDFLIPLLDALQDPLITDTNCGKVSKDVTFVASKLFTKEFS